MNLVAYVKTEAIATKTCWSEFVFLGMWRLRLLTAKSVEIHVFGVDIIW